MLRWEHDRYDACGKTMTARSAAKSGVTTAASCAASPRSMTRQSGAAIPVCCPRLFAPGVRSAVVSGDSPTGLRLARGYGVVLRGTESLLTHRWRKSDSNFRFRAHRVRFPRFGFAPRTPKPSGGQPPCVPLLPLPSWTISRSARKRPRSAKDTRSCS
jgi:hypothetical protein